MGGRPPSRRGQAVGVGGPEPGKFKEIARVVWFEAWRYQTERAPVVALLHEMRSQLEWHLKFAARTKKVAAVAVRDALLSLEDLTKADRVPGLQDREGGRAVEREHLAARLPSHTMREQLTQAIDGLLSPGLHARREGRRVVVIIDDLDRCDPEAAYRLLEGLKIYLTLPNCVFVIGRASGGRCAELRRGRAQRPGDAETGPDPESADHDGAGVPGAGAPAARACPPLRRDHPGLPPVHRRVPEAPGCRLSAVPETPVARSRRLRDAAPPIVLGGLHGRGRGARDPGGRGRCPAVDRRGHGGVGGRAQRGGGGGLRGLHQVGHEILAEPGTRRRRDRGARGERAPPDAAAPVRRTGGPAASGSSAC